MYLYSGVNYSAVWQEMEESWHGYRTARDTLGRCREIRHAEHVQLSSRRLDDPLGISNRVNRFPDVSNCCAHPGKICGALQRSKKPL